MSKDAVACQVEVSRKWELFLERAEPLLLKHEAESNLFWEVGRVLARSTEPDQSWRGWVVSESGEPILAGLPSVTGYLILSTGEIRACPVLAAYLSQQGIRLHGVSGPDPVSDSFATSWAEMSEGEVRQVGKLSCYLIDVSMELPTNVEGWFRKADAQEGELVREWAIDFAAESPHPMEPRQSSQLGERMLGENDLYVWEENQEVVAMGGFGRETPNGLIINLVYVPRNRRGRGFAGALTLGLVREALERGKEFCCLYSDFRSSVRRNLYERIGFRMVGEFTERAFGVQSDNAPSERQ
tara:strand:+ start:342 stop:1235 length:894 start_codon:yes stop_codon:yes gene_type:complete